jgi:hypothetical protein
VTGLSGPIFEELRKIIDQYPKLTFPAFTQKDLRRPLDDREDDEGT